MIMGKNGGMSNIFGAPKSGVPGSEESRTVPTGDTVGSYNSYLDAQKAVDYLADQQFPVQVVSIVGNDLKMVERVTGRLSYPRVALSGALSGMWFGLFVGVMLSFFSPTGGYFSIVASVLMGAAFFMLFGIVTYAMQRGKRDFTSTSQVVATNYDVVVAFEASGEARRLLQQLPMTPSDASSGAPRYNGHQGQAPQRPATWNDPYGQAPGAGQQPGQTPGTSQQQPGQAAGTPQHQPGQAPAISQEEAQKMPAGTRPAAVRYPDLPDGRPQYGVRVTEPQPAPQPQEPQPQAAQDNTESKS